MIVVVVLGVQFMYVLHWRNDEQGLTLEYTRAHKKWRQGSRAHGNTGGIGHWSSLDGCHLSQEEERECKNENLGVHDCCGCEKC